MFYRKTLFKMKTPFSFYSSHRVSRAGFSLIELLTVMAILAILATMSQLGVTSLMKGQALRGAAEQTWSAVANARQLAVSKRMHVALVLTPSRVKKGETEESMALMVLSAHLADSSWTWAPESRWISLPTGIAVTPEGNSFFASAQTGSDGAYGQITDALPKLDGETITEFSYIVFRPDGSVDATASTQPVVGFRRLKSGLGSDAETALVLNPESGRMRLMEL